MASKPKLGSGKRFKQLTAKLKKRGVKNPKALAAYIGRKKYGKKKVSKTSSKGKKEMIKKIKQKICEFICNVFNIIPCMCKHNCDCKKGKK